MQSEVATTLVLHFVEPDLQTRADLVRVGMSLGHHCELYSDLSEIAAHPPRSGIIIVRDRPEIGSIDFIMDRLMSLGISLPVVAIDDSPLPGRVVNAVKGGALDYLVLPLKPERLASCLARIEREARVVNETRQRVIAARQRLSALSAREREVLECLAMGSSNKEIARTLEISPRTVEIHRANMMNKLGARHAAEVIRMKIDSGLGASLVPA